MPWSIEENHPDCPDDESWAVVKDDDGEVEGCHATEDDAQAQLAVLNAQEENSMDDTWRSFLRDIDQVRGGGPNVADVELRADGDGQPTMVGHFSVFNRWYEVDSFFEGHFLERVAPGAFTKTFQENGDNIKVLFNHGHDRIGNQVLGVPDELREDDIGAYYEVPLFDTSYNRDLIPGLEAGAYGASFRFRVIKDMWDEEPGTSDHNPDGIPERTILETRTHEFGPVTFPASPAATAGIRSLTDRYYENVKTDDPQVYEDLLARARQIRTPDTEAARGTSAEGAATSAEEPREHSTGMSQAERQQVVRRKQLQKKGIL